MIDEPIRLPAHFEGLSLCQFASNGRYLFTAGEDGVLRAWTQPTPLAELTTANTIDENFTPTYDIDVSSRYIVLAQEDGQIRAFDAHSLGLHSTPTRFSIAAWSVALERTSDPNSSRLAAAGEETVIKVVSLTDKDLIIILAGHEKGIKGLSWHPAGKILSSCSLDGTIRFWDVGESDYKHLRRLDDILPTNTQPEIECKVHWHPSGRTFTVATRTNEIAVFAYPSYAKQGTFASSASAAVITAMAYSPNGLYLVSAARDGVLSVWNADTRAVVTRLNVTSLLTRFAWHPTDNALAFMSIKGDVTKWNGVIPEGLTSPTAIEQTKTSNKQIEEPEDEEMDDDWMIDDKSVVQSIASDAEAYEKKKLQTSALIPLQPPFQPGSSKLQGDRAYLAWTTLGVVSTIKQDTHALIHVDFFDQSAHRSSSFQDHTGFTLGAIGAKGVFLAAPSVAQTPAKIYYKPHDTWAASGDWSYDLSDEEPQCCACAADFAVIATDRDLLRFFTASGIQKQVCASPGYVVALTAYEDSCMVVWRDTDAPNGVSANLNFTIYSMSKFSIRHQGSIALRANTTLSWIGFTDEGIPSYSNSKGMLYVLDGLFGRNSNVPRWVPFLDTTLASELDSDEFKKGRYWMVGASEECVVCVALHSKETDPSFPRPVMKNLKPRIPLLDMQNSQASLEEQVIRKEWSLKRSQASSEDEDTENAYKLQGAIDKLLLMLVQEAAKASQLVRAMDTTKAMHRISSIAAVQEIAKFYKMPSFYERLIEYKAEREGLAANENVEQEAEHAALPRRATAHNSNGAISTPSIVPNITRRTFEAPPSSFASLQSRYAVPPPADEGSHANVAERESSSMPPPPIIQINNKRDAEDIPVRETKSAKTTSNPFARPKTVNGSGSNGLQKVPSLHKSESFFNKVDSLEAEKENSKAKSAKQTTLFGFANKKMPLALQPTATSLDSETLGSIEFESQIESQEETQVDTQYGVESKIAHYPDEPTDETQIDMDQDPAISQSSRNDISNDLNGNQSPPWEDEE